MKHTPGFQDLVKRAQAGDPSALDQLLAVIRPWLEQLAHNYADPEHPEASSADLVQDAWLRAWQKLDQFQGGDDDEQTFARFRAWVGQMVRRLGLNARRDRSAQHRRPPGKLQRLPSPSPGNSTSQGGADPAAREPTPSAHVQAEEQVRLIRRALEKIADPLDREIIRLRFFESLSLRQVAEQLQVNHEKVRQRYHAMMRHLGRELEGLS